MSFGRKLLDIIAPPKRVVEEELPESEVQTETAEPKGDPHYVAYTNGNGNGNRSLSTNRQAAEKITKVQTGLSLELQRDAHTRTDIDALMQMAEPESPAQHALLKKSVKTILNRRGLRSIDETTSPKIAEDLGLILEASNANLSVITSDINKIKKVLVDGVSQNRRMVEEYRSKKVFAINTLLAQLKELEQQVAELDKVVDDDDKNLTSALSELESYGNLLMAVSKLNLARGKEWQE
ncbi:MAG: hypothetical protein IAF08_11040 [Rhizobacter sp.]|nr:hypothetical protein [Chlorobiales bacterium]